MAYVSLYRKYRPQTFDDVVGQSAVIRTLANAITEDRLHHAYLFTGPRGTGKTSTARILAKAINCEQGPTPSPCNECRQCTEITDGSSVDVIELDMASHGGVDDARELRDRALFAPAGARRKVYILDEVHMASTAAFNALLKLIEEPPEHVMFAMATTDPQKVLPTIMSRVQRLDLRRVSAADVAGNVRRLCELEGYTIEDAAVEAVVRAGDGSLRDTQSVLEQVLAFAGTDVTADAVAQVLGQTPVQRVVEVVDLLARRDVAGLLASVQRLVDDGHDLRRFTLDLVQHVRDLLVLGAAPDRPDLVDTTEERRAELAAQAASLPPETLLRAVTVLASTVTEQRLGSPRLPLELALAGLVVPAERTQVSELADRVARLEAASAPVAGDTDRPREPDVPPPARLAAAVAAESVAPSPPSTEPTKPPDVPRAAEPAASADDPGPAGVEESSVSADGPGAAGVEESSVSGDGPGAGGVEESSVSGDGPGAGGVEESSVSADQSETAPGDASSTADLRSDDVGTGDDLASILGSWDAVLEVVREGSRRHHAIFLPATPIRYGRGILTLQYGRRYASFHAAQAGSGDYAAALRQAVEQVCGLKVRLEIVVEGDDARRRPLPPNVTPQDARTPVLHDESAVQEGGQPTDAPSDVETARPSPGTGRDTPPRAAQATDPDTTDEVDDEAAVREAEFGRTPVNEPHEVGRLLADELGAELVDERPPPT